MIQRLFALWRTEWRAQALGVGLSAMVTLANIALLGLSGWFIAAMALSGSGGPRIEYFVPAAAIRGLAIVRTVGRYGERVTTHDTTLRLLARLRVWLYERLEPLAPAGLARYRGGDLLTRLRADVDSLEGVYLRVVLPVVSALVVLPVLAVFLARFSPAAAVIDLTGLMLAGFGAPWLLTKLTRPLERQLSDQRGAYTATLIDITQGYAEWLVDGALVRLSDQAETQARLTQTQERQRAWLSALAGAAGTLSLGVMVVAVLFAVSGQVERGTLDGPELSMMILLILGSFETVAPLPGAFKAYAETKIAAARILELADAPPRVTAPVSPAALPRRYDIAVRGLVMRYAPDQPPILDGLTFSVPQGTCLGILGPSGAGKTSLLNVLQRFWPFEAGSVEIGDVALTALNSDSVCGLYAVVSQTPYLFNTTIRENLLLACPQADEAALWHALEDASLAEEVRAMPDGLLTRVGEHGSALSGGQGRRLAVARAFLRDAPILLLDEPTEGLDTATEKTIIAALSRLRQGRTTLLITHRPETLKLADACITVPSWGVSLVAV
ncbi:MAG TPA: thiol reductant ABC exporter subunit CydC [Acidocella sp.]|nr:MAG: thiol reductant ABC exporter subunit CydC [Acidocella sp. 20-61-6]HQT47386.1 thiol reductant ABC exporter subunit CydC [Acidocella sp.]